MKPTRSILVSIAGFSVSLALLGCADDPPSTDDNQGGAGQGGEGTAGTAGTAGDGAGGGGGDSSGGCSCAADELCVTCNSAGPSSGSCVTVEVPGDNEFACKWTACAVGQVCLDIQPAGDGCPDADCAAVPPECAPEPTCECLSRALTSVFACNDDGAGNFTVKKYPF